MQLDEGFASVAIRETAVFVKLDNYYRIVRVLLFLYVVLVGYRSFKTTLGGREEAFQVIVALV